MDRLFDKTSGTSTSYNSSGITDSSAAWVVDEFVDWYVTIGSTEYLITANTTNTLSFTNALAANAAYEIAFVGRDYLTEIESECSDTTRIPSALISKKYAQVNNDLNNKVFAYLRNLCTNDTFDPLENILNLIILQQSFAYLLLTKIYEDLSIEQDSFESFKGFNMYGKAYNDTIKDALALIQIDFDEDGVADYDEKNKSVSSMNFFTR